LAIPVPIGDGRMGLPIADFIADCRFHCRLPISLPIADCRLTSGIGD
jgi:hypothetical protein